MNVKYLKKIDGFVGRILARLFPRPAQTEILLHSVSRVLIIRPGGIGDAVLLIPMILCLRKTYPEARIEVLAEKRNSEVFSLCSEIDQVLCYDKMRDFLVVMRRRYDVVIDTEQWHRLSALVARLIRSRMKIGFGTNERIRLFSHPVAYLQDAYEGDIFLSLLGPLGIDFDKLYSPTFLTLTDAAQRVSDKLLGPFLNESFIVLFPGASIAERCWGVEKFRQLAMLLVAEGFSVVVVGGREDADTGNAIVTGIQGLNLAGKTSLVGTAGVLTRSRLLISGDSGVLHLGVGLGVSTVSLFGPGIALKWAPRGELHAQINHHLACSPCTQFGTTPSCPIGVKCMRGISADEVFMVVQRLLNVRKKRGADAF